MAARKSSALPTREELLAYIEANPDRSGKREIAKHFGIKAQGKIELKRMLRELADDGLVNKRGKRHVQAGHLPHVTVFEVASRDDGGELQARPVQWNENEEGAAPLAAVRQSNGRGKQPTVGLGDRFLGRTSLKDGSWTVRVMKRLEKGRSRVLGVFRKAERDGYAGRIEPVERRGRELLVRPEAAGDASDGDLVEIEVQRNGRFATETARIVSVVGSIESERAVSLIAIHAHDIPHVFPDDVLTEAEAASHAPSSGREDWRDLPLITIDPATAKDHDDAVHAAPDPENEGGHIVTVAIADVSLYVRPGSAMDREAEKRGNSVYFPDRVVPMLPERISNDLCSLRENEDRAALAVRMRFDANGRKTSHSFHRILMRNHAFLAYETAQGAIDGTVDLDEQITAPVLRPLWDAYACLTRGRADRSPLEINSPERRLRLDQGGRVAAVEVPPRLDAHRLIEEFMIQANVAAAETLERKRQQLIYRTHDAPSLAKLESLREFLKSLDLPLANPGQLRPHHFNAILGRVADTEFDLLVNQVVLRSQSQAEYQTENIGHFGLNLQRYAHFTSPIRRYADLIVHRALVSALGLGEGGLSKQQAERLPEIAAHISNTERRAMAAERDTVDRLVALHLKDRIGATFAGHINGVTKSGLFVTLDETGADGFVPISKVGREYFRFDEPLRALIGAETGEGYRMGDAVEVKLVEAAPLAGALRFDLETEPRPIEGHDTGAGGRKGRGNPAKGRTFRKGKVQRGTKRKRA